MPQTCMDGLELDGRNCEVSGNVYRSSDSCGSSHNHSSGMSGVVLQDECEPLELWQGLAMQTGQETMQTAINADSTTIACSGFLVWDVQCPCNGRPIPTWHSGSAVPAHELYG